MTDAAEQVEITAEEERRSAMSIIRRVVPYLWPEGQAGIKVRVVVALIMLILAKVASVITPFFYKGAVAHDDDAEIDKAEDN